MPLKFQHKAIPSALFGQVYRPVADVLVKHKTEDIWLSVQMVVDTGADYTIMPRSYAHPLGIDLTIDCTRHTTYGVGGSETVFLFQGLVVRLGKWERQIPLGFLDRDDVPALLGRQEFFETFKVTFEGHEVTFAELSRRRER